MPLINVYAICHRPGLSIARQKEVIIRERDRLSAEVEELNKSLQSQKLKNDAIERKRIEFEAKCKDLYKLLDVRHFLLKVKIRFLHNLCCFI